MMEMPKGCKDLERLAQYSSPKIELAIRVATRLMKDMAEALPEDSPALKKFKAWDILGQYPEIE